MKTKKKSESRMFRLDAEASETVSGFAGLTGLSESKIASHLVKEAVAMMTGDRAPSTAKAYLEGLAKIEGQRKKEQATLTIYRSEVAKLRREAKHES